MPVGSYVICENTWLDDGPNFFWSDPILVARCSKTKASQERKYRIKGERTVKYRSARVQWYTKNGHWWCCELMVELCMACE
jgi:hypothetical protein